MIKYNLSTYANAILGLFGVTFIIVLVVDGLINRGQAFGPLSLSSIVNNITLSITIDIPIWYLFVKWLWKWYIFRNWLVPFPNLTGTWEGEIKSNWENKKLPPIPVSVEIDQGFFYISIKLKTAESDSYSNSASFDIDKERGLRQLFYSYSNTPKPSVRERSPGHHGTVLFKIGTDPVKVLEGEYWTSRETIGEIHIQKIEPNTTRKKTLRSFLIRRLGLDRKKS